MEEITETIKQRKKAFSRNSIWMQTVFMFSLLIFRRFVSFEVAWLLAGILSSFVSYPALPKPRVGIVKYFLTIQGALLASLVGLFFIPPLLQTVMPAFWAYVLPLLLLANAIYFVPPLDGSSRGAWWKWIVSSFVVAGLYGWFMGSLKR